MSETLPVPAPAGTPPLPFGVPPTSTVSDPPTFRSHFPEFADTDVFPDTQVQFMLDIATAALNPCAWASMLQAGVEMFAAHMLAMSQRGAGSGGTGGATGLMTNKSVSKVSVGYDQSITAIEGGGPWNYTTYGQRFWWWARLVGIGGYETLSVAPFPYASSGTVMGWATGVMMRWGA